MSFAGFTEADFDAYLPARGSSNAFNRPRVEAKQKALAMVRALLDAAGEDMETRASEEVPSLWNKRMVTAQWVFFWRNAEARKRLEALLDKGRTLAATLTDPTPYFRHAFLAFYLDATLVEVALKVHGDAWVDVRNLRARCADPARRDELLAALHSLPEDFVVGVTGGATIPARDIDGPSLSATFDALTEASQWWFVGRSLPRAEAIARGGSLGQWCEEGFRALAPVYRIAAWSHDNDLVSIEAEADAARAARLAHIDEEAAREAAWRAEHEAEIARRQEAAGLEARARAEALVRARPAAVHAAVQQSLDAQPPPPPQSERPAPKPAAKPAPRPAPKPDRPAPQKVERVVDRRAEPKAPKPVVEGAAPVAPGVKVKVRNGPFADRVGTVAEVDGRGHARVMFGLIAARLDVGELVTVG